MAVRYLYHQLENHWPEGEEVLGLVEPTDYIRVGTTLFLKEELAPGDRITSKYTLRIVQYARIPMHYSVDQVIVAYPWLYQWAHRSWKRIRVGRYLPSELAVVDVIFGKDLPNSPAAERNLRCTPVGLNWTSKETEDWLTGFHGYWTGWTYDLRSTEMTALVMKFVSEIPSEERTPVRVVRHLTSCADGCNRSDGLMIGKWDGKYADGKSPLAWKCSYELFAARGRTKLPVKYAQCWVFSEMLTSIFRFLGIPARTVYATNARIDRNRDGGIDLGLTVKKGDAVSEEVEQLSRPILEQRIQDLLDTPVPEGGGVIYSAESDSPEIVSKGNLLSGARSCPETKSSGLEREVDIRALVGADDSTWNFHLWNEVYLPRPDLPESYQDPHWQCLDASPMICTDTEDEYAACKMFGPCSTQALRAGQSLPHDFRYMYGAVNSLYRYWQCTENPSVDPQVRGTDTICYVTSISYSHLDREKVPFNSKVSVYTRDPEHSSGRYLIRRDITSNYIPKSPTDAYQIHHQDYPILFRLSAPGAPFTLRMELREDRNQPQRHHRATSAAISQVSYYIQICALDAKKKLLCCHRQTVPCLEDVVAPVLPEGTTAVSTLVINRKTKKWWPQVCSIQN